MFAWTPDIDALEALVPPRRGHAAPPIAQQMGRTRLFRAALKARAVGYEPRPSLVRLMTTGDGDLADEADAFLLACSAPRRGTGVGKISGLSEGEAAKVAAAGVDRWVALRGLPAAVEIFALVGAWRPTPLFSDDNLRTLAAIRLRQWLAHADARAYADALAFARRDDGLPHGMRGWRTSTGYDAGREAIAYLFPDHRRFFHHAAEELHTRGATTTLLLGAATEPTDHGRIADRIGDADLAANAVVIPATLREHDLPALLAHAARPRSAAARLGLARALTAYATADAAHAITALVGHRHPLVGAYLAAHPALAIAPRGRCA